MQNGHDDTTMETARKPDPKTVPSDPVSDQVYELGLKAADLAAAAKQKATTDDERTLRGSAVTAAKVHFRAQVKLFELAIRDAVKKPPKEPQS